jgi:hypothetical protein
MQHSGTNSALACNDIPESDRRTAVHHHYSRCYRYWQLQVTRQQRMAVYRQLVSVSAYDLLIFLLTAVVE